MNQEDVILLRLNEVLRRVSISKASLYRAVKRGDFPAPIKIGNLSLWRAADIAALAGAGVAPSSKIHA